MTKQCSFCFATLIDTDARFEVHAPATDVVAGAYCSEFCHEAARTRKSVDPVLKALHADAECVLSDEGNSCGGRNHESRY